MKFVFLVQYLISSIWLKAHFLKPSFVLQKLLIFHGIFPPKVLLAAVFKNSGFFPWTLLGQSKNNTDLLSNIVMCHDLMYKQNPLWQKNTCKRSALLRNIIYSGILQIKKPVPPCWSTYFRIKKKESSVFGKWHGWRRKKRPKDVKSFYQRPHIAVSAVSKAELNKRFLANAMAN